jgi:hypothetical protein
MIRAAKVQQKLHIRKFLSGNLEKVEFTLRFLGIDSRHYARIRDGYVTLKKEGAALFKNSAHFCVWSAGRDCTFEGVPCGGGGRMYNTAHHGSPKQMSEVTTLSFGQPSRMMSPPR